MHQKESYIYIVLSRCQQWLHRQVPRLLRLLLIFIFNSNPYTARFLGFSVYISHTTNKEDGVLCFRDTNYTNATIPNPVNITCPYHGRYVIYYNNRTHPPYPEGYSPFAFNELCEVEVHGKKSVLFYGMTRSKSMLCLHQMSIET